MSITSKEGKSFYLGKPLTSILQLDLVALKVKKGGFKLAVFGISMPGVFKGEAICARHAYDAVEKVVEIGGSLTKKVVNLPYDREKQFQYLIMEVLCLVWAQALLDVVYDFIKEAEDFENLPFHIPQFRFIKAAIAIEQSSSTSIKKTMFLLEDVIDENIEGPFRKYLNNVPPEPLVMKTKEDDDHAKFFGIYPTRAVLEDQKAGVCIRLPR